MRVTHLSTYDLAGGAARAAYRLHVGLRSIGHDSHFLALYKSSDDPTVLQFDPPRDISARIRRGLRRRYLSRCAAEFPSRTKDSTLFSDDRSQHGGDVLRRIPKSDVLNLHWVAGFIDYGAFFRRLPPSLPLIWTLHDMNPFTGGCHYDGGCSKFAQECGTCPQLGSSGPGDLSSQIWRRKHRAYSRKGVQRPHVVAPSRWLADEARKSSLFSECPTSVIPYGIDTTSFQPRNRVVARQKLGVPPEAKTILFVADWAGEERKGLEVFLEATKGLESAGGFLFLAIGRDWGSHSLDARFRKIGFLSDETDLSFVYSAADVFVIPSLQDNLPNTVLEALACGVPTVGSRVGGIPDMVRDSSTGLLVPPRDPIALRDALTSLFVESGRLESMSKLCRQIAVQEYSLETQARRYEELYRGLLGSGPQR
ncbi:MAG: glycosyltransferase [Candidatus Acidiferrum sp.]